MIIPGFLVSLVTFPGVMVHELGHKLFCHLTKTAVVDVCYFQLGNPAGYVIHERPDSVWKHILIGIGPLFVNSFFGFCLGVLASRHFWERSSMELFGGFLMWLAISVAMHSFPSTGDARSIWAALWGERAPISARFVGTPLVGIIFLGALGSVFLLDLAYGFFIAWGLPRFLLG